MTRKQKLTPEQRALAELIESLGPVTVPQLCEVAEGERTRVYHRVLCLVAKGLVRKCDAVPSKSSKPSPVYEFVGWGSNIEMTKRATQAPARTFRTAHLQHFINHNHAR